MDAPNAPNPVNPNVQGPADQNQDQVPIGQVPAQGPMQVVHNVPVQPLPQQVPMQLAPVGNVVPTPQIFYQNLIGKKPEFSGKPEGDAESHLLSMRDGKTFSCDFNR